MNYRTPLRGSASWLGWRCYKQATPSGVSEPGPSLRYQFDSSNALLDVGNDKRLQPTGAEPAKPSRRVATHEPQSGLARSRGVERRYATRLVLAGSSRGLKPHGYPRGIPMR